MHWRIPPEVHERLFGATEPHGTGRRRLCKTCGGWHEVGRIPSNCRPERPKRAPLPAPQVAPSFGEFRTGVLPGSEVIGDRRARRAYMERHGLVDWDAGVCPETEHWTWEHEQRSEIVADLKRFAETDPLALPPDLKAQPLEAGTLDDGTEISAEGIEVIE